MTTLVQDINAALVTLAPAGGVHISTNDAESGVFPYITFFRVISPKNVSLGGPSSTQSTRIQVDVFDRQYSSAAALAELVEAELLAAFSTYPNSCTPLSSWDGYESPVKAHRVSADFSIWSKN
jgi:hypothetical protein